MPMIDLDDILEGIDEGLDPEIDLTWENLEEGFYEYVDEDSGVNDYE